MKNRKRNARKKTLGHQIYTGVRLTERGLGKGIKAARYGISKSAKLAKYGAYTYMGYRTYRGVQRAIPAVKKLYTTGQKIYGAYKWYAKKKERFPYFFP